MDPPYLRKDRKPSDIYSRNGFTFKDHLRLRDFVNKLNSKKVNFMMSNTDNVFIREMFKDFKIIKVEAQRNINPKSKIRKEKEILITNY